MSEDIKKLEDELGVVDTLPGSLPFSPSEWIAKKRAYKTVQIEIEAVQLETTVLVHLLKGKDIGAVGDWLIRTSNGQFCVLKDEVFRKAWELVR